MCYIVTICSVPLLICQCSCYCVIISCIATLSLVLVSQQVQQIQHLWFSISFNWLCRHSITALSVTTFEQSLHSWLPWWWIFSWFCKYGWKVNFISHLEHLWNFVPVWLFLCAFSKDFLSKDLSHSVHVKKMWYTFVVCLSRDWGVAKSCPHSVHTLMFLWWSFRCCFRSCFKPTNWY